MRNASKIDNKRFDIKRKIAKDKIKINKVIKKDKVKKQTDNEPNEVIKIKKSTTRILATLTKLETYTYMGVLYSKNMAEPVDEDTFRALKISGFFEFEEV